VTGGGPLVVERRPGLSCPLPAAREPPRTSRAWAAQGGI